MKKVLFIILVIANLASFGQKDSTKTPITKYVSIGVSMTNSTDFRASSYPSIEVGGMRNNVAVGFAVGRGSFKGMGDTSDSFNNYYYEVRASAYYPVGSISGVFILGYGGYFDTAHNFIEYGAGLSYSTKTLGYGITYSNWDGVNYVTPSITLNF